MHKRPLCLEVFEGIGEERLYPLAREAGFDGFFTAPDVAEGQGDGSHEGQGDGSHVPLQD